jgi:two-component system sensor histidine kinase AlgZ
MKIIQIFVIQRFSNLLLILVLELVAVVLGLTSARNSGDVLVQIAIVSLYVQWIGLTSALFICQLQKSFTLDSAPVATVSSLLIVTLVTTLLAVIGFKLNQYLHFGFNLSLSIYEVVLRDLAVAIILYSLALRYFYIRFTGQKVLKTEASARLQALQARIRPHFLFNSLNTIASLTHDEPDQAEQAIENLAELFRASLQAENNISLDQEIELTRDYIELEALRLVERLTVNWHIEPMDLMQINLPALTLQPLVENAIYHGIEPLPGGGVVDISISQNAAIHIDITNPLTDQKRQARREGNQMALENIRERLKLAFQGAAKIEQSVENDLYKVVITLPI